MLKQSFAGRYTRPVSAVYFVREGEGEGGAGAALDPESPAVKALIAAAVEKETLGLKAKRDELLGNERKLKDQLQAFGGLDPAKVKELQDRLDQDEDAKLISEGKKELVIEKYTTRMREQHARELEAERAKIAAESQRADQFADRVLENHIRAAAKGMHNSAVEDAILHGKTIFKLDAKGNAVKLDSEGRPELGKDGSTPFGPAEWMEQQKEQKPHWFLSSSSGSGSNNANPGGGGTGKTIKRADFDQLPAAKQAEVVKTTRIVD